MASSEEAQNGWGQCLKRLEEELSSDDFNTWIRPLHGHYDEGRLVLLAPNRYVCEEVERGGYLQRIAELVSDFSPGFNGLELTIGSVGGRAPGDPARAGAKTRVLGGACRHGLNANMLFDNFVEGQSNDVAKFQASNVAEALASKSAVNGGKRKPLLVYGGVGLGKTHLMHAVGNAVLAAAPSTKTLYVPSERFVNDMVLSIRTGAIQKVMRQYRSVEVLLIDDIQFFANKSRTQEEFFHLFNAVLEAGHQLVLTCDRYPGEVDGLEVRLKSRFVGGLAVQVQPPDLETRAAILQRKGDDEGVPIRDEVALHIAKRIRSNVRELEGALQRVLAHAKFTGSPVTIELVRRALHDLFALHGRLTTIEHIQKIVAVYYNIKPEDMLSKSRARAIARPRQMAMALAKEFTNHSLPEIGDRFGGRDHTTVLYARRRVAELREKYEDVDDDYKRLSSMLNK